MGRYLEYGAGDFETKKLSERMRAESMAGDTWVRLRAVLDDQITDAYSHYTDYTLVSRSDRSGEKQTRAEMSETGRASGERSATHPRTHAPRRTHALMLTHGRFI